MYNKCKCESFANEGGDKMIKKMIVLIIVMVSLLLSSCTTKTSNTTTIDENKMMVYTSFYAMYDFAGKIGGDKINLINLIPTGTEPHDWEPSAEDIVNLEKADVFIYNGAGMEGWVEKVLESLENKDLIIIETSRDIEIIKTNEDEEHEAEEEHESEEEQGHAHLDYDPHVWLDPMFAKKQMEAIKEGLIIADPENKEYYENNYLNNAKLLDELDEEFKDRLALFTKREIIVAHEAYGYLCKAYELKQVPIEGLNADAEPSAARMAEIIEFAKANNIKTIFFEELVSPKVAETIANEIGAQTEVLSPLEGIMEEDLSKGKDYFSVMRDNLEALVKALEASNK
jgi:zinc transport system substrate-binding protein